MPSPNSQTKSFMVIHQQKFVFGASLTALKKKDGFIRPVDVGCTLRYSVAMVASCADMKKRGLLLAPVQLGFGTPHGVEAAAHAV